MNNHSLPMATRATQKQLAYFAYWQARGYQFPRNAVIPESKLIKPDTWNLPRRVDLLVSALMLVSVYAILWCAS